MYNLSSLTRCLLCVRSAPKTFNLDIALLKLVTPVKLNDAVNLICLPSTEDKFPPGTECLTAGWGHSEECKWRINHSGLKNYDTNNTVR